MLEQQEIYHSHSGAKLLLDESETSPKSFKQLASVGNGEFGPMFLVWQPVTQARPNQPLCRLLSVSHTTGVTNPVTLSLLASFPVLHCS